MKFPFHRKRWAQVKFTGRIRDAAKACGGSMYIFLSVFLILLLLILSFLVFSLRLFVISNEISRAFDMNCADLVTKIRIDHFISIAETDRDSIDSAFGMPSNETYRQVLINDLVNMIAQSLSCEPVFLSGWVIAKDGAADHPAYCLSDFEVGYGDSIGTLRAKLNIPILLNGQSLGNYVRDLEYSFALSYKNQ